MNNKLSVSIECFSENLQLFGDPQSNPEKYNLYNGLANLAEGIGELENEIDRLKREINQIISTFRR